MGNTMGETQYADVSMTEEGREIAELIEYCYVEMSYGGEYETREQCQAVAKSRGLEMDGAGVGRDIYTVGDDLHTAECSCILKIPKNLVGAFESRREIQTWRDVEEFRPFLAPVLDHGMGLILMPEADQDLNTNEINDCFRNSERRAGAATTPTRRTTSGRSTANPSSSTTAWGATASRATASPGSSPVHSFSPPVINTGRSARRITS